MFFGVFCFPAGVLVVLSVLGYFYSVELAGSGGFFIALEVFVAYFKFVASFDSFGVGEFRFPVPAHTPEFWAYSHAGSAPRAVASVVYYFTGHFKPPFKRFYLLKKKGLALKTSPFVFQGFTFFLFR
jgi:hypothetical protein